MLSTEVIDHSSDLLSICLALVRDYTKLELFLRRLKATIRLRDKVRSSVIVNSYFALILAVCLSSHRIEGILVRCIVSIWRSTKIKVSLSELSPLSITN